MNNVKENGIKNIYKEKILKDFLKDLKKFLINEFYLYIIFIFILVIFILIIFFVNILLLIKINKINMKLNN
jgi:hypothetical protein